MKKILSTSLLALALASGAHAADSMQHMEHGTMPTKAHANASLTEGVVKKVDRAGGKITLTHGPLPNGMPGMTMAFKVKDTSRLDGLNEGQKVLFALDDAMTVIRLEPAK